MTMQEITFDEVQPGDLLKLGDRTMSVVLEYQESIRLDVDGERAFIPKRFLEALGATYWREAREQPKLPDYSGAVVESRDGMRRGVLAANGAWHPAMSYWGTLKSGFREWIGDEWQELTAPPSKPSDVDLPREGEKK